MASMTCPDAGQHQAAWSPRAWGASGWESGCCGALRPSRRAPSGGKLLDFPVLQLIGEVGEPFREREGDLDVDALRPDDLGTGAARRLDPGVHVVRPEVVVCLFQDVRYDRAAAAHVAQDGFQARPQFRALGIGQRPRVAGQLPRTADGLGCLGR